VGILNVARIHATIFWMALYNLRCLEIAQNHNTHNASTTTGLSSAVCNLCSRFDDAFEAVWN